MRVGGMLAVLTMRIALACFCAHLSRGAASALGALSRRAGYPASGIRLALWWLCVA